MMLGKLLVSSEVDLSAVKVSNLLFCDVATSGGGLLVLEDSADGCGVSGDH